MYNIFNIIFNYIKDQKIKRHIVCQSCLQYVCFLPSVTTNSYSFLDERTAGYVATGMCAEAQEPVVIWCANNASFRNLAPALTEAYYRKLPILVIAINCGQTIDQTINPEDILRYRFSIPEFVSDNSFGRKVSEAIACLFKTTTGPTLLEVSANTSFVDVSDEQQIYDANDNSIQHLKSILPNSAIIHLGNDFTHQKGECREGKLSKLIGAAVIDPTHLFIGLFYSDEIVRDLNMLGNRHVQNNIIVVNMTTSGDDKVLFDFAKRMSWDCSSMTLETFQYEASSLSIHNQPQYIEITK